MTIDKAIKLLQLEYKYIAKLKHIEKPVAYALYRVWKMADEEKKDD